MNVKNFNFIQKIRSLLINHKTKRTINKSTNKKEKNLEQINDQMDYDGMGNYGRFPPERK